MATQLANMQIARRDTSTYKNKIVISLAFWVKREEKAISLICGRLVNANTLTGRSSADKGKAAERCHTRGSPRALRAHPKVMDRPTAPAHRQSENLQNYVRAGNSCHDLKEPFNKRTSYNS
jgi:hypothetical protein